MDHTKNIITFTMIIILFTLLYLCWESIGQDLYCTSPECKRIVSEILQDLHPDHKSIDPCVDFYKLTCGGFEEKYNRASDDQYINQRKILETFPTSCNIILTSADSNLNATRFVRHTLPYS